VDVFFETRCISSLKHMRLMKFFTMNSEGITERVRPCSRESGFTCLQSTVNRQPSLSPSVGQRLHAYQTASVVKAASLTEASSENRNRKTCVQPSCSCCLERFAARLAFCRDTRTIQIRDEETFLRTGSYKLIT